MTIELSKLRKLKVRRETTFATDMTSGGTSFTSFQDVPFIEDSIQVSIPQASEPVAVAQQFVDRIERDVMGLKECSLSFSVPMHATGVVAAAGVTSVNTAMGTILKAMFGGESLDGGTTYASGGSTSAAVVADGSKLPAGTAAAVAMGAGGAFEIREVKDRTTNTITFKEAFSASLTGATAMLRSATYYFTEPATDPATLQFVLQGVEADDLYILEGMNGGLSFGWEYGKIPTMGFTLKGRKWIPITTPPATALSQASYSNFSPIVLKDSEFHFPSVGSVSKTLIDPTLIFSATINIDWIEIRTPGGPETGYGKRRDRKVPVATVQFTVPYQDESYRTLKTALTRKAVFIQCGNSITGVNDGAWMLSFPNVQVVDVEPVDWNGIKAQQITCKATNDWECSTAGAAAGASEIERSAVRYHVF